MTDERERVAQLVYERGMLYLRTELPAWVPGGNSLAQTEARAVAALIMDAALAEIGAVRVKPEERHSDTERNRLLSQTVSDLFKIIENHDPEVDIPIASGVWDRLYKLSVDVEARILAAIEPAPAVSVQEAARVLLDAWSQETVKGCQIRCEVTQAQREESIRGLKFSAALRAIAEGKDDE
jgi:hypothetical protein